MEITNDFALKYMDIPAVQRTLIKLEKSMSNSTKIIGELAMLLYQNVSQMPQTLTYRNAYKIANLLVSTHFKQKLKLCRE